MEGEIECILEELVIIILVYMLFIIFYFMLRELGDWLLVVLNGFKNFVFIGNFVDIEWDMVFIIEYFVWIVMEVVY